MTRTLVIEITDTPKSANEIALALRKCLMDYTAAFVWDNNAVGSAKQPRKLEASFPEMVREKK
jgi:hypothetical protein